MAQRLHALKNEFKEPGRDIWESESLGQAIKQQHFCSRSSAKQKSLVTSNCMVFGFSQKKNLNKNCEEKTIDKQFLKWSNEKKILTIKNCYRKCWNRKNN